MKGVIYLVLLALLYTIGIEGTRRSNVWRYVFRQRETTQRVFATCLMVPRGNSTIKGVIEFSQHVRINYIPSGELRVQVNIQGLSTDDDIVDHGLHIHKYGDIRDGCMAAGSHYNPLNQDHGGRRTTKRHVGDLGNVREGDDGTITEDFTAPLTSIAGPNTIIGRALVLHELQDDLGRGGNEESKKTGNAGSRVACCVIGRTSSNNLYFGED